MGGPTFPRVIPRCASFPHPPLPPPPPLPPRPPFLLYLGLEQAGHSIILQVHTWVSACRKSRKILIARAGEYPSSCTSPLGRGDAAGDSVSSPVLLPTPSSYLPAPAAMPLTGREGPGSAHGPSKMVRWGRKRAGERLCPGASRRGLRACQRRNRRAAARRPAASLAGLVGKGGGRGSLAHRFLTIMGPCSSPWRGMRCLLRDPRPPENALATWPRYKPGPPPTDPTDLIFPAARPPMPLLRPCGNAGSLASGGFAMSKS